MFLTRTRMLFGSAAVDRLQKARVLLFGLGGVGGSAAEALARSGIGFLHLVDADTVEPSNLNRQLFAARSTIGLPKTQAAKQRLQDVSDARIETSDLFYLPETADTIDFAGFDYVVDAIDTVAGKLAIAEQARAAGIPQICCLGTGNRTDPSRLRIGDLYETSGCPLARVMRRECRKRGIDRLRVLYSTEEPRVPIPISAPEPGKRQPPASCAFVPPAAGLLIASQVVRDLIAMEEEACQES